MKSPTKKAPKTQSQRVKRWFTHDWEAKLIALVLAFLLWSVVRYQLDRTKPELPEGWPMRTAQQTSAPAKSTIPVVQASLKSVSTPQ